MLHDRAHKILQNYILTVLRDVTGLNSDQLAARTPFEDIALESLAIMSFNGRIGPDFPTLSKTMLFDCRTAEDVSTYLEKNYSVEVGALLDRIAPEAASADVSSPAQSAAASVITPAPAEPDANADWDDIAPLADGGEIDDDAIAIIGMSGRFPGAPTLARFWSRLLEGHDAVREIPAERWQLDGFYAPDAKDGLKSYAKWGAFLDRVDAFDNQFFSISAKDAATLDPQGRIFLECAWHALEDAALLGERAEAIRAEAQADIGVFVGVTSNTYPLLGNELWRNGSGQIPNSMPWYFANRLSFALNLNGPSLAVDTACSSSLVAVHLACASLRNRECRAAVAGGVNLYLHPAKYVQLCQQNMLSRTGRCSAFGAAADGFVPGEGVGAVVLKTMRHAVEDGDKVLAVIRGSAVRHGGHTNGFTVPSPVSQRDVIAQALRDSKVAADTISYIEAHGTGTKLGDPIEIDGLRLALGDDVACGIGSVKSNIGHLESAAGIASLLKLVLQMQARTIAPSIHAERLNPALSIDQSKIFVTTRAQPWSPPPTTPLLRAGVSSFGAGGTNAHIIVEEAPVLAETAAAGPNIFILSALSENQLRALAQDLLTHLDTQQTWDDTELAALAYTLQCGRKHFTHRFAAQCSSKGELHSALSAFLNGVSSSATAQFRSGRARDDIDTPEKHVGNEKALAAWVEGAPVVWRERWTTAPRPASAPVYPFATDSHWVAHTPMQSAPADPNTQPGVAVSQRAPDNVDLSMSLTHTTPFVRDHKVANQLVVPAAAYLSLAKGVANTLNLNGPLEIANAAWSSPAVVPADGALELKVRTTFKPAAEITISTANSSAGVLSATHFTAQLRVVSDRAAPALVHSLESVRARCRTEIDTTQCYRAFVAQGIQYGASFRCLDRAWSGTGEAVVELRQRLPRATNPEMPIDPALLDGVLQSAYCAAREAPGQAAAFVPFGAKSIRITEVPSDDAIVYAIARPSTSPDSPIFDFTVYARDGRVQMTIESFAFRKFKLPARSASGLAAPHAVHLLAPVWRAEPLAPTRSDRSLLIFSRDTALFDAMRASVKADDARRVWLARDGSSFDALNTSIEWDSSNPKHADLLIRYLTTQSGMPQTAVFDLTAADMSEPANAHGGIWQATSIIRTLYTRLATPKIHACFVLSSAHVETAQALTGLLKSVHHEIPTLTASVIQIDPSLQHYETDTALRILDEALSSGARSSVTHVLLEPSVRKVQGYAFIEPAKLPAPPGATPRTIVVAGGTGALGRLFVEHLSRAPDTRIAILGASPQSEATTKFIAGCNRAGAHVHFVRADCADRASTERALMDVRATLGPITDVLHCAGILRDEFFVRQTGDAWNAVLRAKISTARNLDDLTRDDPIERFVVCSSLAGTYGNVGQSAYAFANAWLDGFAVRREAMAATGERSGRTQSIAWPLWDTEGGMQAPPVVTQALARLGLSLLPGAEGVRILGDALDAPVPVLVPVRGDKSSIAGLLNVKAEPHPRGALPMAPKAITAAQLAAPTPIEHTKALEVALLDYITDVLCKATGTAQSRIDADASLEGFGLDSIIVSQMNALMEERFPNLSKTALFEVRSLRDLARLLMSEHPSDAESFAKPAASPPVAAHAPANTSTENSTAGGETVAGVAHLNSEGIAIVGIAGRYPGSATLDDFWQHLQAGADLVIENPARWPDLSHDAEAAMYARWGGFLDDVDTFDPLFFGISPRDAERMDPQERLFLQTAYHAIENAGYTPETLTGPRDGSRQRRRVAVIAGVMYGEYQFFGASYAGKRPPVLTNSSYASIANRVSYCFDFDGPSFAVDSMCSSSLTSIHLACQLLRAGGCHVAIAGGVNLSLHPYKYRMLCDMQFASSDGKCRSFGDGGDGYVPGEGVGAVVLRPLADALANGDHIYGIIRGSDIGHGGRTSGYTVPNADAQSEVVRNAFAQAGIPPERCSYIEAHGTGTSLGDPIELRGLAKVFGTGNAEAPRCAIGSVKSNIGHLESAAGVAGLTKVLLQLQHDTLVPSLHAEHINPKIDFDRTTFALQRTLTSWPQRDGLPRVAGISAMGAGGANAHLVVEEASATPSALPSPSDVHLFLLSSQSSDQLRDMAARMIALLSADVRPDGRLGKAGFSVADVANTLRHGRRNCTVRLAIVARTFGELAAALARYLEQSNAQSLSDPHNGSLLVQLATPAIPENITSAARAWLAGEPSAPAAQTAWRHVPLPGYAFLKRRYWVADEQSMAHRLAVEDAQDVLSPQMIVERVARGDMTDSEARSLLLTFV